MFKFQFLNIDMFYRKQLIIYVILKLSTETFGRPTLYTLVYIKIKKYWNKIWTSLKLCSISVDILTGFLWCSSLYTYSLGTDFTDTEIYYNHSVLMRITFDKRNALHNVNITGDVASADEEAAKRFSREVSQNYWRWWYCSDQVLALTKPGCFGWKFLLKIKCTP